jgi:RNA polymerase-associated protein CTR9
MQGVHRAMASIEIPLRNSSEVVEVFLDELPDDVVELITIIRDEIAPLHLYIQFAV